MDGTLSIQGDLNVLSQLAVKIDEWFPGALEASVQSNSWGGWTVDRMALLLERVHPWQLLLVSFLARGGGRQPDVEVRRRFTIEGSGLKGQTGAISKHIVGMKKSGLLPEDASWVVQVDRSGATPVFVTPAELVPIVQSTLELPQVQRALDGARLKMNLNERE